MHDLLVQPLIHMGTIEFAAIPQILRERAARRYAAIETQQLHQIDNRVAPVKMRLSPGGHIVKHARDVNRLFLIFRAPERAYDRLQDSHSMAP